MISSTGEPAPVPVPHAREDGWIAGDIVAPAAALFVEHLTPSVPRDH